MRPKIPPQIVRLILLTIGIVGSYFVARAFLTPHTFGDYGWYRGAALAEMADRPISFAGKKACDECHSDVVLKLAKHEHKTLSCEGCHGPADAHATNPDAKLDKPTFAQCVRCHEANPSRPTWHKQIVVNKHYQGKCTECHVPHSPNDVP
jgi:hypothetical protein